MPHKDPEARRAYERSRKEQNKLKTQCQRSRNPEKVKEWRQLNFDRKKQWLSENLGDCCSFCGSKENLEVDHINPGLRTDERGKCKSLKHFKEQLEINNLRHLCEDCHKKHSFAQHRAAIALFNSLPLAKQEELIMGHL